MPPPRILRHHARLFSTSLRCLSSNSSSKKATTLTHLTPNSSEIHVVSISNKAISTRQATAVGYVRFGSRGEDTLELVRTAALRKGDVLAVARVAGIMAAKRTSDLIPLCHPAIQLEGVRCWVQAVDGIDGQKKEKKGKSGVKEGDEDEDAKLHEYLSSPIGSYGGIRLAATVSCSGKTGVEMEALCAVAGAGLCVLDMVKGVDREAALEGVRNVRKSGGRSGSWFAEGWEES